MGESDSSVIQAGWNILGSGSSDTQKNLRETEFVPTYQHNEDFDDD